MSGVGSAAPVAPTALAVINAYRRGWIVMLGIVATTAQVVPAWV
jgi:hypothetical protein